MIFLLVIWASLALWQFTLKQESTNTVSTACFKINFKEKDDINIENAYPISDDEGSRLTPYTFTIENICNTSAFYQINLEELTLPSKRLSNNYIKVSLNKSTGKILSTYQSVEKTLDNADISHKLTTGRLSENETKDFELRLWLDNDTPLNEDTISASFMSKITIITVHQKDFDNDLSVDAKSLTENYTNTEEAIEFKVTSRDYNIIEVSEDNIVFNPVDTLSKEITINKTYTEDGTYTMYFKDEVGNIIEKTVDTTKLDKIAPVIQVEANELQDGIKVNLSKSTDNKSGIKKYYYKLNNNDYIESTSNIYTFTNLSDGKYNVEVKLEDNAGNFTDEETLEVTVAYEHVYISNTGSDESGNGSIDLPYATLQRAYNKVKSGGEMILLSDITATTTTNMNNSNKEVTLKSNGTNIYSVTKATTLTSRILDINNQNTITTTNITFDGNNVNSTAPLILGKNSVINLKNKTTIQNSKIIAGETSKYGAGINVSKSILNIDGATISSNRIQGSSWTGGGGIYASQSTINIYSGSISNNIVTSTAAKTAEGGAIYSVQSTFNLYGGIITENQAHVGAGVIIVGHSSPSYFYIMDGEIKGNKASVYGGGVLVTKTSTAAGQSILYLKGGSIIDNTAPSGKNTHVYNGGQIIDQR